MKPCQKLALLLTLATALTCTQRARAQELTFPSEDELLQDRLRWASVDTFPMGGGFRASGYTFHFSTHTPYNEHWFPYKYPGSAVPVAFLDRDEWPLHVMCGVGAIWKDPTLSAGGHAWYEYLRVNLRRADGSARITDLEVRFARPEETSGEYAGNQYRKPFGTIGEVVMFVSLRGVRRAWGDGFSGRTILEVWIDTRQAGEIMPMFLLATTPYEVVPRAEGDDAVANRLYQDARMGAMLEGDVDGALAIVEKLRHMKPKSIWVHKLWAEVLVQGKRYEEAIARYEENARVLEEQFAGRWGDPDYFGKEEFDAWKEWAKSHGPQICNDDGGPRPTYPYQRYDPAREASNYRGVLARKKTEEGR